MKRTFALILLIPLLLFGLTFALDSIAKEVSHKEHVKLMETLLPGGKDFYLVPYTDVNGTIRTVHQCTEGYVIETATQGYADEIVMLVGVDNKGNVTGLVVLKAHETPGLGGWILTDHKFLSGFLNQSGSFTIGSVSESDAFSGATSDTSSTGNEIAVDGITGATVSSKAVARCVSAAVAYVTGADINSSATEWGG